MTPPPDIAPPDVPPPDVAPSGPAPLVSSVVSADHPRPGRGRPGLFLARDSYRQRRLRDAARMLPVLGIIVWLLPLMWRRMPGQTGGMAAAVVFVFAGWVLLIVLTGLIVRRLRPDSTEDDRADDAT